MNKLKLMTILGTRPEIIRLSEVIKKYLCYSEHARRYLNYEGVAKERTYVIGSPMAEVLTANIDKIKNIKVIIQSYTGIVNKTVWRK